MFKKFFHNPRTDDNTDEEHLAGLQSAPRENYQPPPPQFNPLLEKHQKSEKSKKNVLKKYPKKLKISIPSKIYYTPEFNQLFWTKDLKELLKGFGLKWEYDFENQYLILNGKKGEQVEQGRLFIYERLLSIQRQQQESKVEQVEIMTEPELEESQPVQPKQEEDDDEVPLEKYKTQSMPVVPTVQLSDSSSFGLSSSSESEQEPKQKSEKKEKPKTLLSQVQQNERKNDSIVFLNGRAHAANYQSPTLTKNTPLVMNKNGEMVSNIDVLDQHDRNGYVPPIFNAQVQPLPMTSFQEMPQRQSMYAAYDPNQKRASSVPFVPPFAQEERRRSRSSSPSRLSQSVQSMYLQPPHQQHQEFPNSVYMPHQQHQQQQMYMQMNQYTYPMPQQQQYQPQSSHHVHHNKSKKSSPLAREKKLKPPSNSLFHQVEKSEKEREERIKMLKEQQKRQTMFLSQPNY